jgi:leucyl-tRNA synthetase
MSEICTSMEYNFAHIEAKWKNIWEQQQAYKVSNTSKKPKCYVLDMFPYPSGAGLHVGHPLGYIASDIYARFKRLQGFNVLHPMGFDSFGLPAEQYALETGQHPADTTRKNIERYKQQLHNIGFCYDWDRAVYTSDPGYYKWTQWIFTQLYNSWYNTATQKAEPIDTLITQLQNNNTYTTLTPSEQDAYLMQYRLAYKAESTVNWCEALGTVLANDEVINGISERGGHPVERKLMSQWFLRITQYAERLLSGLNEVQYSESLKEMQRNWIGKSKGAEINFLIADTPQQFKVFTTRPDTLYGVSFMVIAPEHNLVNTIVTPSQSQAVQQYLQYTSAKSDKDRQAEKKITGVFTGAYAVHPLTQQPIPIWISEYVLVGYGTGAIMAVPAGDERDYAFAQHFKLQIPNIFEGHDITSGACTNKQATLCNSEQLNGLTFEQAFEKIISILSSNNIAQVKTNYRLRDAGFSRQRYWGEPFPVAFTNNNTTELITQLPVELPHVQSYGPGPGGKGPLANITDWVQHTQGVRETDTMPGYAGSSWYYLRYMDPHNDKEFASRQATNYWQQVDVYIGGAEHAVGHLLYSRMWCKVLHDLGYISFDEPYKKIINQGMIGGSSRMVYRVKDSNLFVSAGLIQQYDVTPIRVDVALVDQYTLNIEAFKQWRAEYAQAEFILEDGKYICGEQFEKMSKRYHNVVNPDDVIAQYGADTFRMYEMFLGPVEMSKPWDTKGIEGTHRFLRKLWRLFFNANGKVDVSNEMATPAELKILHKHLKKIQNDIEQFAHNTAVSQFMITTNELSTLACNKSCILEPLVISLAPFAPHIAEELYSILGNTTSVLDASYPAVNEAYLVENEFTYPVAIQGKTRTELSFALDTPKADIEAAVLANEIVQKWIEGKPIKKFIFVQGKMINVVV